MREQLKREGKALSHDFLLSLLPLSPAFSRSHALTRKRKGRTRLPPAPKPFLQFSPFNARLTSSHASFAGWESGERGEGACEPGCEKGYLGISGEKKVVSRRAEERGKKVAEELEGGGKREKNGFCVGCRGKGEREAL